MAYSLPQSPLRAVLMAWIVFSAFLQSSEATAPPRIVCTQPVFDFGVVDGSQPVSHTFHVRNDGDSDLVIKKIHAPCGCTTFRIDNKTIPPGTEIEVPVDLSLAGRRGPQQKSLHIETNDPAAGTLTLTLRGTVGGGLEVQPPMMVLRREPTTGIVSGSVLVRDPALKPLRCLESASSSGRLLVTSEPLENGAGFRIHARLRDTPAPGHHREKITLRTDHPLHPTRDLDALVIIAPDIVVAPSILEFSHPNTTAATRTLIVKNSHGGTITIDSVEVPDPSITTKIQPMGDSAFRITLGNIQPTPAINNTTIRIHTGGDAARILEVTIHVLSIPQVPPPTP